MLKTIQITIISLLFLHHGWAQSSVPAVGIPTVVVNAGVEVPPLTLTLIGEAVERGLSTKDGLRIVDRQRLDAVFTARNEVRHEDYLASNRDKIVALGADYLLIARITNRALQDRNSQSEHGFPQRVLSLRYTIRFTFLEVANGRLLSAESSEIEVVNVIRPGEPDVEKRTSILITGLESKAAQRCTRVVRTFIGDAFIGETVMVDILDKSGKRATEILLATKSNHETGQELKIFTQEWYMINGDSIARPVALGEVRVKQIENQLLTCKVTMGGREIYSVFQSENEIFATQGEQRSYWLIRLMSMGLIE